MDRLDSLRVAVALALTAAVLNGLCAVAFLVSPDGTFKFFGSWMHGLEMSKVRSGTPETAVSVGYGIVAVSMVGFLTGLVFASLYNVLTQWRRT